MTFDSTGRRGIDKKKRGQYLRLLYDLTNLTLEELYKNRHYRYKFFHDKEEEQERIASVINTIEGIYTYLVHMYEQDDSGTITIPKDLYTACKKAMEKWQNYETWRTERYEKRWGRKYREEEREEPDTSF